MADTAIIERGAAKHGHQGQNLQEQSDKKQEQGQEQDKKGADTISVHYLHDWCDNWWQKTSFSTSKEDLASPLPATDPQQKTPECLPRAATLAYAPISAPASVSAYEPVPASVNCFKPLVNGANTVARRILSSKKSMQQLRKCGPYWPKIPVLIPCRQSCHVPRRLLPFAELTAGLAYRPSASDLRRSSVASAVPEAKSAAKKFVRYPLHARFSLI